MTDHLTENTDLHVDVERVRNRYPAQDPVLVEEPLGYPTGILVGARWDDRLIETDIELLDRPSLLRLLHSRGGCNRWAEQLVLMLLGHDAQGDGHDVHPGPALWQNPPAHQEQREYRYAERVDRTTRRSGQKSTRHLPGTQHGS